MRHRPFLFRRDPDVEIERVLYHLANSSRGRRKREADHERAVKVMTKRHEYGRDLWSGDPLTEEEKEMLREELQPGGAPRRDDP